MLSKVMGMHVLLATSPEKMMWQQKDWMKSLEGAKQQCVNNVFTLFHCAKKHWLRVLKCVERYFIFIGLFSNFIIC